MKLHVVKNDIVKVLSGDEKGKMGIVTCVYPKKYSAIVQGVNIKKKHIKKKDGNPGKVEEKEFPILLNKLMVVNPENKIPSRICRRKDEKGKYKRCFVKQTSEKK